MEQGDAKVLLQQSHLLEKDFGVTLLHRSTRKLTLTDAGVRFADHAEDMMTAADRALNHLRLARDKPDGELRVSAPVGIARYVAPALGPILAAHPGLRLCLLVDDAQIDLIDRRIDLALRGTCALPESGYVARAIHNFEWAIYAAPAYLVRKPGPQAPTDLLVHDWIGQDDAAVDLDFLAGERRETVRLSPRVSSNIQTVRQQLCVAGLGIARVPCLDAQADLTAGRLVQLLEDWRLEPVALWAVTPQRDGQPAKVRQAIAAIEAHLAREFGGRAL